MGLFDGIPLTEAETTRLLKVRRLANLTTIRKISKSGRIYTARHRPWGEILGPGPVGKTCGDCQYLQRIRMSKTFFKCGQQVRTHGAGTDIGARDKACRLFVIA